MNKGKNEIDLINKNFQKLNKKLLFKGVASYKKIDLHIHTPSSNCYVRTDNKNTDEKEYKLLIERMIESDVDIFAITDHNNINGYENIIDIINNTSEYKEKLLNKLILPGIEIDCYGNHFLTIFNNEINLDKIKNFISNCGLENKDIPQSADKVTPLLLCEKVYEMNGIVILAHADSTKGFLYSYFKKSRTFDSDIDSGTEPIMIGKSIEKVLNNNAMLGISINDYTNIEQCQILMKQWNVENKKILRFSDSHSSQEQYIGSGKPLGKRSCYIKMGKLSYNALLNSLRQINNNVSFEVPQGTDKTFALGIAVQGGFLINNLSDKESFAIFPFSPDLNCLIGARGTGKSTLLEIIDYIYNCDIFYDEFRKRKSYEYIYDEDEIDDNNRFILNRFERSILYLRKDKNIYAIYIHPDSLKKVNISIYIYDNNKSSFIKKISAINVDSKNMFKVIKLREELKIKVYKQKDLQDMTSNKTGIFSLIDNLNTVTFGLEYLEIKNSMRVKANEIKEYCKKMVYDRINDSNADYSDGVLEKSFNEYFELYKKYIKYFELNIKDINERLDKKLQLDYNIGLLNSDLNDILYAFEKKYNTIYGNSYEKLIKYKRDFRVFTNNIITLCPNLLYLIFTHKIDKIYNILENSNFKISKDTIKAVVDIFWRCLDENSVVILPLPIIDFKLNVNYGFKNSEHYVERNKLSFGQKTVGALLLIMHGAVKVGDNIPLIIDQPEDDLDNSYIYHMLIKQFNDVKTNKQLIIATHNPNIPVCGESENILVLGSNGKNGWLEHFGTIDNQEVAKAVLKILEGDFDAFKKRAEVYGFELHQKIFQ